MKNIACRQGKEQVRSKAAGVSMLHVGKGQVGGMQRRMGTTLHWGGRRGKGTVDAHLADQARL